jgi:hypothetical protein
VAGALTDRTSPQGSEGAFGVFALPSAALYCASSSFCFCCSAAARAAAASWLSAHVFTFSPAPRLCWENATLVSNKSVSVDATKVLMGPIPAAMAMTSPRQFILYRKLCGQTVQTTASLLAARYSFRNNPGSFATLAAIRRASSRVSSLAAADCRPGSSS